MPKHHTPTRRIRYSPGDIIGPHGAIYLADSKIHTQPCGQVKRRADFLCGYCGKKFNAFLYAVKDGSISSCGCALTAFCKAKEIRYHKGQRIGDYGLSFVCDSDIKQGRNRCAVFKCACGTEFVASIGNVKIGNTTSCGCYGHAGHRKQDWLRNCRHHKKYEPCLYVIEIQDKGEHFLKIGLAADGVENRFVCKRDMPYSYSIVRTYSTFPYLLWDKEAYLKHHLKEYQYKPNISFGGYTECFSVDSLPYINMILDERSVKTYR